MYRPQEIAAPDVVTGLNTQQQARPAGERKVSNSNQWRVRQPRQGEAAGIEVYAGSKYVCQMSRHPGEQDMAQANARRIVACVNACEGIRTEALEWRGHLLKAADDTIAAMTAQRDRLEREFLESWLHFAAEPVGQECCGRAGSECCGCPDPVYLDAEQVIEAMAARHRELAKPDTQSGGHRLKPFAIRGFEVLR